MVGKTKRPIAKQDSPTSSDSDSLELSDSSSASYSDDLSDLEPALVPDEEIDIHSERNIALPAEQQSNVLFADNSSLTDSQLLNLALLKNQQTDSNSPNVSEACYQEKHHAFCRDHAEWMIAKGNRILNKLYTTNLSVGDPDRSGELLKHILSDLGDTDLYQQSGLADENNIPCDLKNNQEFLSLTGYFKSWNRYFFPNEEHANQRRNYLIGVVCVMWSLYNQAALEQNDFSRGSYKIIDKDNRLFAFLKGYVQFATGYETPWYSWSNNFAYSRAPAYGLSSHYKDSSFQAEQYGIDMRLKGDQSILKLLPNEFAHLLFGDVTIGDKHYTFIKFEPVGMGSLSEWLEHALHFTQSGHVEDQARREKDVPENVQRVYDMFFETYCKHYDQSSAPRAWVNTISSMYQQLLEATNENESNQALFSHFLSEFIEATGQSIECIEALTGNEVVLKPAEAEKAQESNALDVEANSEQSNERTQDKHVTTTEETMQETTSDQSEREEAESSPATVDDSQLMVRTIVRSKSEPILSYTPTKIRVAPKSNNNSNSVEDKDTEKDRKRVLEEKQQDSNDSDKENSDPNNTAKLSALMNTRAPSCSQSNLFIQQQMTTDQNNPQFRKFYTHNIHSFMPLQDYHAKKASHNDAVNQVKVALKATRHEDLIVLDNYAKLINPDIAEKLAKAFPYPKHSQTPCTQDEKEAYNALMNVRDEAGTRPEIANLIDCYYKMYTLIVMNDRIHAKCDDYHNNPDKCDDAENDGINQMIDIAELMRKELHDDILKLAPKNQSLKELATRMLPQEKNGSFLSSFYRFFICCR